MALSYIFALVFVIADRAVTGAFGNGITLTYDGNPSPDGGWIHELPHLNVSASFSPAIPDRFYLQYTVNSTLILRCIIFAKPTNSTCFTQYNNTHSHMGDCTCNPSNNTFEVTAIIYNLADNSRVELHEGEVDDQPTFYDYISLKYCPYVDQTEGYSAKRFWNVTTPKGQPVFNSTVEYHCLNGSVLYVDELKQSGLTHTRRCQWNATWTDEADVECKIAPFPILNITQPARNGSYYCNDTIDVSCSAKAGYPENYTVCLSEERSNCTDFDPAINNTVVSSRLVLDHANHGMNITCNATNSFGSNATTKTLDVLFPPILKSSAGCWGRNRNATQFKVTMQSNPPIQEDLLFVSTGEDTLVNISEVSLDDVNMTIQQFSFTISPRNHSNNFVLSVGFTLREYAIYNFSLKLVNDSCRETDTVTAATNVNTDAAPISDILLIALAASGGFLVFAVVLLVTLLLRRKPGDKKEVVNPIYDTTSMVQSGTLSQNNPSKSKSDRPDSEKVEHRNPLYGTTADATYAPIKKKKKPERAIEQPEIQGNETYAAVNKLKKAKKKTGESPEAQENETYAAVNKIKKGKKKSSDNGKSNYAFAGETEAMYAAVDKKKNRAAKDEDQPSTSGLGNSAQVSHDCTYAALQKRSRKKPKDADDDEDLHGSSK